MAVCQHNKVIKQLLFSTEQGFTLFAALLSSDPVTFCRNSDRLMPCLSRPHAGSLDGCSPKAS